MKVVKVKGMEKATGCLVVQTDVKMNKKIGDDYESKVIFMTP